MTTRGWPAPANSRFPDDGDSDESAGAVEAESVALSGLVEVDGVGRITNVEVQHVGVGVVVDVFECCGSEGHGHSWDLHRKAVTIPTVLLPVAYDDLKPPRRQRLLSERRSKAKRPLTSRRGWDLNPRYPEVQRFSRPSDSAALAPLLGRAEPTSAIPPLGHVASFRWFRCSPTPFSAALRPGFLHQIVSTSPESWIAPSRVTSGASSASAVATMNRSHGSARATLGIVVVASRDGDGSRLEGHRIRRREARSQPRQLHCRYHLGGLGYVPQVDQRGHRHDQWPVCFSPSKDCAGPLGEALRALYVPDDGVGIGNYPHEAAVTPRARSLARSKSSHSRSGKSGREPASESDDRD